MSESLLTESTTSSPDQQLQLESYKEQTASWRHLDSLFHRFTSVILPVSIAALALPYLNAGTAGAAAEMPKWIPIAGGLVLMVFWIFSSEITGIRDRIRFDIIHKMEGDLGMINGHKEFKKRRAEKWTKRLRSHYLRRVMFVAYVAAAGVLLKCF